MILRINDQVMDSNDKHEHKIKILTYCKKACMMRHK